MSSAAPPVSTTTSTGAAPLNAVATFSNAEASPAMQSTTCGVRQPSPEMSNDEMRRSKRLTVREAASAARRAVGSTSTRRAHMHHVGQL